MVSKSTKNTQLLSVLTLAFATQWICFYFDLGVAIHVCNVFTSSCATFGVARQQTTDGPCIGEKCHARSSIPDGTSKR
jgi:hypothetical protein